jgi:hypothetical protein
MIITIANKMVGIIMIGSLEIIDLEIKHENIIAYDNHNNIFKPISNNLLKIFGY